MTQLLKARPSMLAIEIMPWPIPAFDAIITQQAISRATIYRARCGMRRPYSAMADAMEYERGYCSYPDSDGIAIDTPAWTGYFDAERDQQMRDEARADAAFEEQ